MTVYIYETWVYTISLYLYPYALIAWAEKTLPLHMTYSIKYCTARTVDAMIYIFYLPINYNWYFLQVYYVTVQNVVLIIYAVQVNVYFGPNTTTTIADRSYAAYTAGVLCVCVFLMKLSVTDCIPSCDWWQWIMNWRLNGDNE